MKKMFSWRGTQVGGLFVETAAEVTMLVLSGILVSRLLTISMWWHALGVSALAFTWVIVSVVLSSRAGLRAALTWPRLRAAGRAPMGEVSWHVLTTTGHAEVALGLALDFRRRGQLLLANRMARGVFDMLDTLKKMDAQRHRLVLLPGERNEHAARKCVDAMEQLDTALVEFSVHLAEASGAEVWNEASVDQALESAGDARAAASALAEVSAWN